MFRFEQFVVIEVQGSDATKIFNNLTTNDLAKLPIGQSIETFITNVRGWVVAHGFINKEANRVLFAGFHSDSEMICNHIEKYIIREDAKVLNLTDQWHAIGYLPATLPSTQDAHQPMIILPADPWIEGMSIVLKPKSTSCDATATLPSIRELDPQRIRNGWPLWNIDIPEKCLPQELDRDTFAISFTKGCYLGQETIARLDALGQLQKKLSILQLDGPPPQSGEAVLRDGTEVGRITSTADTNVGSVALAYLRRGNFALGTKLVCGNTTAVVVERSASTTN